MTALLHTGRCIKRLFYVIVHSTMMGQSDPKYIGVDVVKYCDCDELCAFVRLHCGNCIFVVLYTSVVALCKTAV
jgi:hypothetical protein